MNYDGIFCIDKPRGFTSFDVIAKLRGMTRTKRVGHAGTLDPMATGVLPIFFGRAAKAVDLLPNHDKEYRAALQLGVTTDTQDAMGQILSRQSVNVTAARFEAALMEFEGEQEQLPPMYSAVRVNGQRLYDIARSGGEIERTPRRITIYSVSLIESDEESGCYTINVKCSKGTYIRALCSDLGERLGCGATMTELRRTAACGFTIDDCITLEEAQSLTDTGGLESRLMPVSAAFAHLPVFLLTASQAKHFRCGLSLGLSQFKNEIPDGQTLAVYENERFLGLAAADRGENVLKIIKLFALGEDR